MKEIKPQLIIGLIVSVIFFGSSVYKSNGKELTKDEVIASATSTQDSYYKTNGKYYHISETNT